jgi:hypothetical protein
VWIELNFDNHKRKTKDIAVEFLFNFRSSSGYLKGSVSKIFFVKPEDDQFSVTIGWGSDIIGTWSRGDYFAEVIFMDHMLAQVPFEIGDDYVAANEEDFVPLTQIEYVHLDDLLEATSEGQPTEDPGASVPSAAGIESIMHELDELTGLDPTEVLLLRLALSQIENWQRIEASGIIQELGHVGLLKVFSRIGDVSRQEPERFGKLASLLASFVEPAEVILTPLESADGFDFEEDNQLLGDCIQRIRERRLKDEAQKLAAEIKIRPTPEKLEQFMNLQRQKVLLEKSASTKMENE